MLIEEESVIIATSRLKTVITLDGFKMSWYTFKGGEWKELFRDRQTQTYNFDKSLGQGVYHYVERKQGDIHLGLGEKAGNVDVMGYDADKSDPLYKHIPFYITKTNDM